MPHTEHFTQNSRNDITQPVKHLKVNNNSITDTKEIAHTLGNAIAYNSSTFQSHKTVCERNDIRFPPADNEPYYLPITLTELTDAIRTAHNSSPVSGFWESILVCVAG